MASLTRQDGIASIDNYLVSADAILLLYMQLHMHRQNDHKHASSNNLTAKRGAIPEYRIASSWLKPGA